LRCLRSYFQELTITDSATVAFSEAKRLNDQGVIDDCHLAAHFIGEASYEKFSGDTGKAFALCPLGCIQGCQHGVMEAYVASLEDSSLEISAIANVCDSVSTDTLLREQCVHGVGHGILQYAGDIELAFALCDEFNKSDSREECLGGVLMENVDQHLLLSESELKKVLPDLCEAARKNRNLLQTCLETIGEGLMFYTGHDLDRSKQLCRVLPKQDWLGCYNGAEVEFFLNQNN